MWVTVLRKFSDKYTGEIYHPGDRLNLKKDRVREILKKGPLIKQESKNEKETDGR